MRNKKLLFIGYLLFLLVLSMCFIYKFEISENGYYKNSTLSDVYEKRETSDGDEYIETLKVDSNVRYIDIYFNIDTDNYVNGEYYLEVSKDDKIIYDDTLIYKILSSGKYRIDLKDVSDDCDISIKLIYSGEKTTFSPLLSDGYMVHQELYKRTNAYFCVYLFLIVMNVIMIFMYRFIMNDKKHSIEKRFLVISIPIFLAFMLLNPMFLGHDERFHFFRVFEITEGGALPLIHDGGTGYYMPSAVYTKIGWGERHYSDILDAAHEKIDKNDISFISDVTMSVYSPVQYTPHVLGVSASKLVTQRPIIIAYAGRLFNLLFCITILYFAIKITPYGKNLFLLFSLIPISIEGFTTLSGDGFTISIAYLFMAYVFNMIERKHKKLMKHDYVILTVLGIILAFCKLVYIPIIGLLLLIPKEYFKSNKKKFLTIIPLMVLLLMFNLFWLKLAGPYLNVYTCGQSNYQISFILHHIITYFCMFMHTFLTNFLDLVKSAFGDSLLWGSAVQNYSIFSFLLFLIAIIVSINDESIKKKFGIIESLNLIIIVVMIIGLIFTSLFIQWTSYGSSSIVGVQGRYFSPFLPLLFILIGNFTLVGKKISESNLTRLVLIVCILANYASLIEFFIKFI